MTYQIREHSKLHHKTPGWVCLGSRFHIRIRSENGILTHPGTAEALLSSCRLYHDKQRWYAWLMVIMPDHVHAILSFPPDGSMSRTVGDWKRYHVSNSGIQWQDNYFDHRIRSEGEFAEKCQYIRMNPVRKELCDDMDKWPWACEPWRDD